MSDDIASGPAFTLRVGNMSFLSGSLGWIAWTTVEDDAVVE